jgi:hypothetical protein
MIGNPEDMSSGLSMMALNIRKAFINARRVSSGLTSSGLSMMPSVLAYL